MAVQYRVIKLRVRVSVWHFLIRYAVLVLAVAVGIVILALTGHREYEALIGAGGVARAMELAGEAAADAFAD